MRVKHFGGWWVVPLVAISNLVAVGREVPLVDAVKNVDTKSVHTLLRQRVDVNAAEADGTTALHWAAQRNDLETADLLLHAGAKVQAANRYGVTPLWLACVNGNAPMIEKLLKAGADPNTALEVGDTALMTAARTGNVVALEVLLAHGADVNAKESMRGQTALMWAAAENNAAAIQALIDAGADIDARSKSEGGGFKGEGGFTALLFAVRAGHIDATRVLLAAGARVNDTLSDGTSALVLSVASAHYELATFLLDKGADPNADGQGWTALHQVVWTRRPNTGLNNPGPVPTGNLDSLDFVKKLVAHGANVNAQVNKEPEKVYTGRNALNRIGATPFLLAAKAVDIPLMRLLIASGADPLLSNVDNTTPLMVAAGVGMWAPGESPGTVDEATEAVKLCLERGGDATTVDNNGDTALHGAAIRGANSVVQLLVENGAKVDVKNKKGWTPLTIADGIYFNGTFKRQLHTAVLLRQLMKRQGGLFD